jgi:hypothetical protein
VQPVLVQICPASQHSHENKQVVWPGAQVSGSHAPSTHEAQRPQAGMHWLGSHS